MSEEVLRLYCKNQRLDEKITRMNVNRCDMELKRDLDGETRQKKFKDRVLQLVAKRSAVIRKLVKNHEELLKIREEREKCACVGGTPLRSMPECPSLED